MHCYIRRQYLFLNPTCDQEDYLFDTFDEFNLDFGLVLLPKSYFLGRSVFFLPFFFCWGLEWGGKGLLVSRNIKLYDLLDKA